MSEYPSEAESHNDNCDDETNYNSFEEEMDGDDNEGIEE